MSALKRRCRYGSESVCAEEADVLILREKLDPPPLFDVPLCWHHALEVSKGKIAEIAQDQQNS